MTDFRALCAELTEFVARLTKHYYQPAELLTRARAALAQPEPAPMPVSVHERLPGPEDCDAEGRCWLYCPQTPILNPYWDLVRLDYIDPVPSTYWLPAHALPLPEVAIND